MHRLGCHLHQHRHRAVHQPNKALDQGHKPEACITRPGLDSRRDRYQSLSAFCKACVTSSGSGVLERVALSTSTQIVSAVEMMASLPAMRNGNEVRPMCRAQTDILCWGHDRRFGWFVFARASCADSGGDARSIQQVYFTPAGSSWYSRTSCRALEQKSVGCLGVQLGGF